MILLLGAGLDAVIVTVSEVVSLDKGDPVIRKVTLVKAQCGVRRLRKGTVLLDSLCLNVKWHLLITSGNEI